MMNARPHDEIESRARFLFGTLLWYAGLGLIALVLLDAAYGLQLDFPRTWYLHRELWGAAGVVLAVLGWVMQRPRASEPADWKPRVPGRRFGRLVVYSRPECHLCDAAKATLAAYLDYLPDIEEVDIDGDPALKERYGETIPVVELDGREYFRGRVDEVLLRRLIEGTPPVPPPS